MPWNSLLTNAGSVWPIGDACNLGVRDSGNSCPDFRLPVALDRGFRRPAIFFAPDDYDLCTDRTVLVIHNTQRNHRAFIIGVAGVGGYADRFPAFDNLIEWKRGIVSQRSIYVLINVASL